MTLVRYNPLNDFVPTTFGSILESALNNGSRAHTYVPKVDVFQE